MRSLSWAVLALLFLTTSTRAEPPPGDLVKAELLADVTAVKPGGTFNIGVLLTIERG